MKHVEVINISPLFYALAMKTLVLKHVFTITIRKILIHLILDQSWIHLKKIIFYLKSSPSALNNQLMASKQPSQAYLQFLIHFLINFLCPSVPYGAGGLEPIPAFTGCEA